MSAAASVFQRASEGEKWAERDRNKDPSVSTAQHLPQVFSLCPPQGPETKDNSTCGSVIPFLGGKKKHLEGRGLWWEREGLWGEREGLWEGGGVSDNNSS